IRALCCLTILYAFYGYLARSLSLYSFVPLNSVDLCTLLGNSVSFMTGHDEYQLLNETNCQTLQSTVPLLALGNNLVTDSQTLASAQLLAWTDVVNAGDWLLVVLVLEVDVRLQLRGMLKGRILLVSKVIKGLLYSVLLFAAIYWWMEGEFIDFCDALLWIIAFIFIEMNVFEWQVETARRAKPRDSQSF
ncbi:MAG: hypothetical protein K9K86_10065, partial [Pseudomonadales bacterium]|nr:hypothetical protein [Pseudomonadales bacterium]